MEEAGKGEGRGGVKVRDSERVKLKRGRGGVLCSTKRKCSSLPLPFPPRSSPLRPSLSAKADRQKCFSNYATSEEVELEEAVAMGEGG